MVPSLDTFLELQPTRKILVIPVNKNEHECHAVKDFNKL